MKTTFLGTAAGQPSLKRNVTSIAIEMDDSKLIMVDCGEATLHQIMRSKIKMSNIHTILITHLHGDHIYGLPGLCCTLNDARTEPLYIFGPRGIKKYCEVFEKSIRNYKLIITEIMGEYDKICNINSKTHVYTIDACFVMHTAECYSYSINQSRRNPKININMLQPILDLYKEDISLMGFNPPKRMIGELISRGEIEIKTKTGEIKAIMLNDYIKPEKDFKIVIAMDNSYCQNIFKHFVSCDVLIHECTFAVFSDMSMEEASQITTKSISRGHSTNKMAAKNAHLIGCKDLILTHFSNRYEINDGGIMVDEDRIVDACYDTEYQGKVHVAYDFSEFVF
jgi:ribonuclease Z